MYQFVPQTVVKRYLLPDIGLDSHMSLNFLLYRLPRSEYCQELGITIIGGRLVK
jgi:hypothetical protein